MPVQRRILIVSHNSLSNSRNNGKTVDSLFRDWPSNKVSQLYFNNEVPDSKNFNCFYRIRDVDILLSLVFPWLIPRIGQEVNTSPMKEFNTQGFLSKISGKIAGIVSRLELTKLIFREIVFGTQLWNSTYFSKWLRAENPEVVFFVGGNSIFSFNIAMKISKLLGIPLYIYITDDYVINTKKTHMNRWYQNRLKRKYKESFLYARKVFVIGEHMAKVFHEVFKICCVTVINSVDPEIECVSRQKYASRKKKYRIVYAGGLHLGRVESIKKFASILSELGSMNSVQFIIEVYCAQSISDDEIESLKQCGICFCGAIYGVELRRRLQYADFLLHVESFDIKYIQKTMLSISTKIPEYLLSGSCVIGYGPSKVSSIRMLAENSIGFVLTEKDNKFTAKKRLEGLFLDKDRQYEFADSAFKYAMCNLSGSINREKIKFILNS